jgi:sugar lactone lactonase YvrE
METKKITARLMRAFLFPVLGSCFLISAINAAHASDSIIIGRITDPSLWSPGKLAVNRHGSVFVVDSYKNCIRQYDAKGSYEGQIPVNRPSAVASSPDGKLYIGSHQDYSVAIYKQGKITGYFGAGKNEFLSIADIAVDETTGDVYVADTKAHLIKRYYSSGTPKETLSGFHLPAAVFVSGTGVYVLDAPIIPCPETGAAAASGEGQPQCMGIRIAILDKKGGPQRSINESGSDYMTRPTDIAVDAFENVYVGDASQKAVLVYDRLGSFIGTITSALDDLHFPVSLVISRYGNLYVSSSETHSITEIGLTDTLPSGQKGVLAFKSKTGAAISPASLGY